MGNESQRLAQQAPESGISITSSIDQPTVSLAVQEEIFGPFVARTLDEHIRQGEHDLRERVAKKTLRIFLKANLYMLGALGIIFAVDTVLLACGLQKADQRLIDSGVIKVLIGATVVEVGALMVIIANWLFPKRAD
jgi:hypothetical protein